MFRHISLVILLTVSSQAVVAQTGVGCNGMEKELLDLTYMSKSELKFEYCAAGITAKIFERATAVSGMIECNEYQRKVLRVLKKDHAIESVECPETMEELSTFVEEE